VNGCWPIRTSDEVRRRVNELRGTSDPVRLLKEIRAGQQQLVTIADCPVLSDTAKPASPTLEQILSGLRMAWKEGEARPTRAQSKAQTALSGDSAFVSEEFTGSTHAACPRQGRKT
jgi:hypothetical protein